MEDGKQDQPSAPAPAAIPAGPTPPGIPTMPSGPAGILGMGVPPVIPQTMLGIQLGQPQQSPEVMQQICSYLSHDSDNRLKWFEGRDKRAHSFRILLLILFAVLVLVILAIPLVSLWRGDMAFVKEFMDKYLSIFIVIVLALLGGGKLSDFLKIEFLCQYPFHWRLTGCASAALTTIKYCSPFDTRR